MLAYIESFGTPTHFSGPFICIDASLYLQMAPVIRILESIVCEYYYSEHPDIVYFIGAIQYWRKIMMLLSLAGVAIAASWVMLVCMQHS